MGIIGMIGLIIVIACALTEFEVSGTFYAGGVEAWERKQAAKKTKR